MPWSLSQHEGKLHYSKKELALFRLIPKDGKHIDTDKLLSGLYGGKKGEPYQYPYNGRTAMTGAMRSLIDKVKRNNEPFRVMKSERRGPHPMEFWIEGK